MRVPLSVMITAAAAATAFPVSYNAQNDGSGIFVELMRDARPWGTADKPWTGSVSVDRASGFPTEDFGVTIDQIVYNSSDSFLEAHPGIRARRPDAAERAAAAFGYTLTLTCATAGDAPPAVRMGPQGEGALNNVSWDAASGKFSARYAPFQPGESVMMSVRNTTGGCSFVSILAPGFDPAKDADAVNPQYLSEIDVFAGHGAGWFRTMGLRDTNGNAEATWAERPLPSWPSNRWNVPILPKGEPGVNCSDPSVHQGCWTAQPDTNHPLFGGAYVLEHGWPWERIITLANAAKLSPWINVPHLADDDYVRSLLLLLKASLDPSLSIYLEWSNEVWNFSFQQCNANVFLANQSVTSGDPFGYNFSSSYGVYQWDYARTAHRITSIAAIAADVFGADEVPNGRVRPVLAGQVMGTPQLVGMQYLAGRGGALAQLHAAANAPYFAIWPAISAGRTSKNCWSNLTVDDVITGLTQSVSLRFDPAAGPKGDHKQFLAFSRFFGLPAVSYEGGPDTSCFFVHDSSTAAKDAANLDPRITDVVADYLSHLAAMGQYQLSYFTCCTGPWSMFGQWTLAPNATLFQTAAKTVAVKRALAAPMPQQAFGTPLPATLDPTRDSAGQLADQGVIGPWRRPGANHTLFFPLQRTTGTVSVRLNVSSDTAGTTIRVGTSLADSADVAIPATAGSSILTPAVRLPATASYTVVRLLVQMPDSDPWVAQSSNATVWAVQVE